MATAIRHDVTTPALQPFKRKIAAIMAADVAGYSRLIAEAEEQTLHELAAAREILDGFVARAGGRIFNTAGDSVMCEFDSAVEAVRAAIDIQGSLRGRNAEIEPRRRLEFRIGITIGDVVERDGDLLGDGVNIAARLESLSPPGGICISRSVHEAVANKITATFRDIGARPVKNLPQPVHAYVIAPPGGAPDPEPMVAQGRMRASEAVRDERGPTTPRRRPLVVLAVLLVLAFIGLPGLRAVRRTIESWQPNAGLMSERSTAPGTSTPPATTLESRTGEGAVPPRRAAEKAPTENAPTKPAASKPGVRAIETGPGNASDTAAGTPAGRGTDTGGRPSPDKTSEKPVERATERTPLPADPAAAFAALGREGLVTGAKTLPEFYHDARVYEAKGERSEALAAYRHAAPLAGDFVDPLLRYAALLRSAQGPAAVRRAFEALSRTSPSKAVTLVSALSADGDDRATKLDAFTAANPDYFPADYLRAESLLGGRTPPTLTERRLAFDAFDRFLEAGAGGRLAPFFVDRAFMDAWLEQARKRRGEIQDTFASTKTRPSATFTRSDSGWVATLSLPEAATAVALRIGERGEFKPASLDPIAPGSGKPQKVEANLPADTGRATLYVTYKDSSGREAGPFPLPFDPMAALVMQEREALERFPSSWVSFRADLPDVLSYAQLASNRCALKSAEIGFNDDAPGKALALPPCDTADPSALPSDVRPVLPLPTNVDHVQVKLTYADGTESQVRTFRRP